MSSKKVVVRTPACYREKAFFKGQNKAVVVRLDEFNAPLSLISLNEEVKNPEVL